MTQGDILRSISSDIFALKAQVADLQNQLVVLNQTFLKNNLLARVIKLETDVYGQPQQ